MIQNVAGSNRTRLGRVASSTSRRRERRTTLMRGPTRTRTLTADSDESEEEPFGVPSESSLLWHLVVPDLRPGYVDTPEEIMVFRKTSLEFSI